MFALIHTKTVSLLALLFWVLAGCQAADATPTLQPGEVEVPFATVVLNEDGLVELTTEPAIYVITSTQALLQLQPLIHEADFRTIAQAHVDYDIDTLIAVFRVPARGCDSFGITVERLVRSANKLTVQAKNWQPLGACSETNLSAYHLVKVREVDASPDQLAISLQTQWVERNN